MAISLHPTFFVKKNILVAKGHVEPGLRPDVVAQAQITVKYKDIAHLYTHTTFRSLFMKFRCPNVPQVGPHPPEALKGMGADP